MAGEAGQRSLEETPTWSVAAVCFVLVAISIAIEHLIHETGKWLMKRRKPALYEAMEKVKSELMLLGFISLLLTVGQDPISNICVPMSVGNSWHPCKRKEEVHAESESEKLLVSNNGRRLLGGADALVSVRRVLAGSKEDKCAPKGKVPLISTDGIHQLHIFIFVLAIFHILYCILTLVLGRLKMRRWKAWERETKTAEYQFSHDPERFRFTRDTSFGRQHLTYWSHSPILIWIVCFFRQFFRSVSKVDYLTLRHGFIMAHLAPQSSVKFDFQKYINRSLEEDFKVVVGISPVIWFFAVIFLLFSTHGWYAYLWLPFVPLIIILLVGTKLQVIITQMAVQIMDRGDVIKGVPVVRPTDNHFWFNRPRLLLNLIHFVLFQNAFQLAFFVFTTYKFGINSCFHEHAADVAIRISMGILIQILCSYVTLPLYALVTQMGSNMKPAIFNERVATALRKWHQTARKHVKENRKSGSVTPLSTSRPATPTHRHSPGYTPSYGTSPVHLLRYYQNELDSVQASPRNYISEADRLDIEKSISSTYNYRGTIDGSSHYRGTIDGSSHNRGTDGSSSHHRKGGAQEDQGERDKEIQLTGDSDQPEPTSPTTETQQAHIAIDFSFGRRRMI